MLRVFEKLDNKFIVATDKVEAFIPERYVDRGFCNIGELVSTVGIFNIRINDTINKVLQVPNIIYLVPKNLDKVVEDDITYHKLTFYKNDIFMDTDTVIKDKFLIIPVFKELYELANMPTNINYQNSHFLLNNINSMAEMDLHVNPVIMEMLQAYLTRTSEDLTVQARYDPSKPSEFIGLRNISYGPDSTTAKIFGSYTADGLRSALVNPNTVSKPLEDLMRL